MENPHKPPRNEVLRGELEKFISNLTIPQIEHKGFSTKCIHAGQAPDPQHGSVNTPIYMTSIFKHSEPAKPTSTHLYQRFSDPTTSALETCLAATEYGKFCRMTSSGVAAIYTVLSILTTGDHIIINKAVYGGTILLCNLVAVPHAKLDVEFVDFRDLENVRKAIKPTTKLIWLETPTNPSLYIVDIEEVVKIAKEHKVLTAFDNTFGSPYLQNPLLLGVDIVMHSISKYVAGHCDLIAGALVMNDEDLYKKLLTSSALQGNSINPMVSYFCLRGIKTLKVRMDQSCRNAFIIAHWMEADPRFEKVYYPGLKSHQGHEISKKQSRGFGAMISFKVKGNLERTLRFLKNTKIISLAFSLGGVHSLFEHPFSNGYMNRSEEDREILGISENFVRFSVGQEDPEDLIEDIVAALEA